MKCEILVIGAGVLGLSSAYYLKKRHPKKRVVVVERHGSPGQGSTAKCAGGFRNMFGSEENRILAESTIDCLEHMQSSMGRNLGLSRTGYLYLYSEPQYMKAKTALEKMKNRGVELRYFDFEDLNRMIPDLVTDLSGDEEAELMSLKSIIIGVQGLKCGTVDADAVARLYELLFLEAGGEIMYNTSASRLTMSPRNKIGLAGEPFVWQDANVTGVLTDKGEIEAFTTVLASGVWSETLLNGIGFESMMRPRKRIIFTFKDPKVMNLLNLKGFNTLETLPLTHLTDSKVYLKPDIIDGSLWLGVAEDLGRCFNLEDDPQPEDDMYIGNAYHALVKYLPCFTNVRPMNSWAGLRAINTVDKVPVVAPGPGMIYVGSDNGTGITKCDALGRVTAALYSGDKEAELFNGWKLRISDVSIEKRCVEKETF